jgi:hypothetical protein
LTLQSLHYPSFLGIRMTKGALMATSLFALLSLLYSAYGF